MKLMISLLALLPALTLQAQTTPDDYRTAVSEYSWALKTAASRSEAAAENMGKAYTGYLPRLSLDGSFSVAFRDTQGLERWTFGVLPQIVQTLYGGGAVRATYDQAQLGYDIALCGEEFSQLEVAYAADYAYWNLSAVGQYAVTMQQYVELIRSLRDVVNSRFQEGYAAKGDVLMIEARLNEAEYQLVSAEKNYTVALHNFNILRGVDPELPVALSHGIRDSLAAPMRATLDEALSLRPDYRAAQLQIDQAGAGVRAARAPYNPQVSVGVGGSWQPLTPNRTGETRIDGTAFVKVSVPIFHWGERRRAVGAARAVQAQTEWNAASLYDDILGSEMNGWTAIVKSRAQIEATKQSLRIAVENLDISTYSYNEGVATILDVLQAQLSWIQLYNNSIRAYYDYALAVSDYRRITAR